MSRAMGQRKSSLVFDNLLAKSHVGHALRQPDGRRNEVPMVRNSRYWDRAPPVDGGETTRTTYG